MSGRRTLSECLVLPSRAMPDRVTPIGRLRFAARRLAWRVLGVDRLYDAIDELFEAINRRTAGVGVAAAFGNQEEAVRAAWGRVTLELNWFEPRWTLGHDAGELPPGVKPWSEK